MMARERRLTQSSAPSDLCSASSVQALDRKMIATRRRPDQVHCGGVPPITDSVRKPARRSSVFGDLDGAQIAATSVESALTTRLTIIHRRAPDVPACGEASTPSIGMGIAHPRSLAIRFGNQISAIGWTPTGELDSRASSGLLERTSKAAWTTQMDLRSRWRRFESCRGRPDEAARAREYGASGRAEGGRRVG